MLARIPQTSIHYTWMDGDKCRRKGDLVETTISRGMPMTAGARTKFRKGGRYGNRNNVQGRGYDMHDATDIWLPIGTALNLSVFCMPVRYMDKRLRALKTRFFLEKAYEDRIT